MFEYIQNWQKLSKFKAARVAHPWRALTVSFLRPSPVLFTEPSNSPDVGPIQSLPIEEKDEVEPCLRSVSGQCRARAREQAGCGLAWRLYPRPAQPFPDTA